MSRSSLKAFRALFDADDLILGAHRPFGTVPPPHRQADTTVAIAVSGLSMGRVFGGFSHGLHKLAVVMLCSALFATSAHARSNVDGNVQGFQGLDSQTVLVLGTDGNLWLEHAPFGNSPPARQHVDGSELQDSSTQKGR
jgi:hypothetical protein